MVGTNADTNTTEETVGVIQAVDVPGRTLTILVHGISTVFDVEPECAIVLHGERVKLRLVQPRDSARVIYRRTPQGLRAQAVKVNSPRHLGPDGPGLVLDPPARQPLEDSPQAMSASRQGTASAKEPPMISKLFATPRSKVAIALAAVTILVVGVVAARPMVVQWLHKPEAPEAADKDKADGSHELVRDGHGKPVLPPMLRISAQAAQTLGIGPTTIVPADMAVEPRPLPPLEGTLAYENDNLFPVRPRFAGEVVEFAQVPNDAAAPDAALPTAERYKNWRPTRSIGFGDKVTQGQLLAIVWSKDLGDKKAALIDATIDLRRDRQRLKELEKLYQEGAVSATSYHEAKRTVDHDNSAVNAAERTLRIWKLSDAEIEAVQKEAQTIQADKRDPKKEKDWARVEVRAPHDGTIVEKNTNLGDWVDPSSGNPMFRVADLNVLAAWVHPLEEYLPILSRLAQRHNPDELYWKIRLQAEPNHAVLDGPILRIAPSVDPTQRTLLVMGQVANPTGRLLVGESISATIYVRPGPNLVVIPTTALNEERGQSILFVQPDPNKLEFVQRRVAVAERFVDVVLVRSKLTPEDEQVSQAAAENRLQALQPLRPGERVVTQGVPMLTFALRDLLAKEALSAR